MMFKKNKLHNVLQSTDPPNFHITLANGKLPNIVSVSSNVQEFICANFLIKLDTMFCNNMAHS